MNRSIRKIRRRFRKWRRSSLAIMLFLLFAAGTGLATALWLKPADLPLQQAQLALSNFKPELALKIVSPVLKKTPDNIQALCLQAEAQLSLNQFDQARKSLSRALELNPDVIVIHELLIRWTFTRARYIMLHPEILENHDLQAELDEIIVVGHTHSKWFSKQPGNTMRIKSRFIQACVTDLDIRRLQAFQRNFSDRLTSSSIGKATLAAYSSKRIARQNHHDRIESLRYEIQGHLKAVIDSAPNHFVAWSMYIDYLSQRNDDVTIWMSAQTLAGRRDLPASLASKIVSIFVSYEKPSLPVTRLVEMGWQLLSAVRPEDRKTNDWKLAAARLHQLSGDSDRAMEILEQIFSLETHHTESRYLAGKIFFKQEKYDQAYRVLKPGYQNGSVPTQYALLYGLTLIKAGENDRAAQIMRQALKNDPDHSALRATFLTLMMKLDRLVEYSQEVRDYYSAHPLSPLAMRLMLHLEQSIVQIEGVAKLIERIESLDTISDDHRLLLFKGHLYLNNHLQAERYAREFIRRQPASPEGFLGLAATMLQQRRHGEALELLNSIEPSFSNDVRIQQLQGQCYFQQGRYDQAAVLFQQIADAHPTRLDNRIWLGKCLANMGLIGGAIQHVEYVLRNNPQHIAAHQLAVRVYHLSGQPHRANQYLTKLDESAIHESMHPLLLARVKLQKKDVEGALMVCERAVVAGNTDITLRSFFVRLLIMNHHDPQAEFYLQSLVQSRPDDLHAFALLTKFYRDHRSIDKSIQKLRRLESTNRSLALLSQAVLLKSSSRLNEATSLLSDLLNELIEQRNDWAIVVADELASIENILGDETAAMEVYNRLIDANWLVARAALQQAQWSASDEMITNHIYELDVFSLQSIQDDPSLRFSWMRKLVALGEYDRALELLDEWIERHPQPIVLYRAKAELLIEAGRVDEAVDEYQQLLEHELHNTTYWHRLAQIYQSQHQYPESESALRSMGDIDDAAYLQSQVELCRLYHFLGLKTRSLAVLESLSDKLQTRDPTILFSLGELSFLHHRIQNARKYLNPIPVMAHSYVSAQLILARMDLKDYQPAHAKKRIESLIQNPRTTLQAIETLLSYRLNDHEVEQLIKWCDHILPDKLIKLSSDENQDDTTSVLSEALKHRWLALRIALADRDQQWSVVLSAMDQLAVLSDESWRIEVARICINLHLNHKLRAKSILQSSSSRAPDEIYAFLEFVVSDTDTVDSSIQKFQQWINSDSIQVNHSNDLSSWSTIFSSDVSEFFSAIRSKNGNIDQLKQLASAMVAREVQLPGLCAAISQHILNDDPISILAHALHTQSMFDQRDVKGIAQRTADVQRNIPDSSLALWLSAQQNHFNNNVEDAIEELVSILQREPDNLQIQYLLSQTLARNDQNDEAIKLLESIYHATMTKQTAIAFHESNSTVQTLNEDLLSVIANDLAFLLAEHSPDRLEEAYRIALHAMSINPDHRSLLDTLGWIEHLLGHDQQALQHLSMAITGGYATPEVHYHIGVVYQSLDDKDWAKYHLEETVSLASTSANVIGEKASQLLKHVQMNE